MDKKEDIYLQKRKEYELIEPISNGKALAD